MAQVSIQYALERQINEWDKKRIQLRLGEITAIHDVIMDCHTGILCVDFDNTTFSEKELRYCITAMNYPIFMIDAITF